MSNPASNPSTSVAALDWICEAWDTVGQCGLADNVGQSWSTLVNVEEPANVESWLGIVDIGIILF